MKDIQNQIDDRRINIKKVGVKTITYPITVLDKSQREQKTIATVNMYVNLPHLFKGTHMSRFIEILNLFHGRIGLKDFHSILEEMKTKLDAEAAHVEITFPFFLHNGSDAETLQVKQYDCAMHCSLEEDEDIRLDVVVPMSWSFDAEKAPGGKRGVRLPGRILVSVRFLKFMWLEDLIELIEDAVRMEAASRDWERVEPIDSLLVSLEEKFSSLAELKWYSITIENGANGYELFTTISSVVN